MELNTNLIRLAAELATDPQGRGYAAMTPAQVVADLTDKRYVEPREARVTLRTLAGVLGTAKALAAVAGIEAAADEVSLWIGSELRNTNGGGLDISHPEATALVAGLVTAAVLTQAEGDSLLDLGRVTCCRAQQIGYSEITTAMVERVRE